jgi:4-hydroxy-2-oxoheptanedioate aldolase
MGIPSPDLAELALRAGFTSVIVDGEHGFPMDRTLRDFVGPTRASGGSCLVRFTSDESRRAGFLADVGLDGFVLSGPRTPDDVHDVVRRIRFAPIGERSVNPFVPAAGEPGDIPSLRDSAANLQIWAMAENRSFLESMEATIEQDPASLGTWTGIIIGPYDLSADLGCAPDPSDPLLQETVRRFVALAEKAQIKWSIFTRNDDHLTRWREHGVDPKYVLFGYDRDIWFVECLRRVSLFRAMSQG